MDGDSRCKCNVNPFHFHTIYYPSCRSSRESFENFFFYTPSLDRLLCNVVMNIFILSTPFHLLTAHTETERRVVTIKEKMQSNWKLKAHVSGVEFSAQFFLTSLQFHKLHSLRSHIDDESDECTIYVYWNWVISRLTRRPFFFFAARYKLQTATFLQWMHWWGTRSTSRSIDNVSAEPRRSCKC